MYIQSIFIFVQGVSKIEKKNNLAKLQTKLFVIVTIIKIISEM